MSAVISGLNRLCAWTIKVSIVMGAMFVYLIAILFLLLVLPFSRDRRGINYSMNRMGQSMGQLMRRLV